MSTPDPTDAVQQQAYELYWTSDETVDQVAERLGLSRGALYPLIRPWPAGRACPECGAALGFVNRTSRAAGRATCDACGFEMEVDVTLISAAEEGDRAGRRPGPRVVGRPEWSERVEQWRDDISTVRPERAVLIGGAAALGIAVGAMAAKMVRERS